VISDLLSEFDNSVKELPPAVCLFNTWAGINGLQRCRFFVAVSIVGASKLGLSFKKGKKSKGEHSRE
jgi:hypothetical protein